MPDNAVAIAGTVASPGRHKLRSLGFFISLAGLALLALGVITTGRIAFSTAGVALAEPYEDGNPAPPCHGNSPPGGNSQGAAGPECRQDLQPDHGRDCVHSDDHVCAVTPATPPATPPTATARPSTATSMAPTATSVAATATTLLPTATRSAPGATPFAEVSSTRVAVSQVLVAQTSPVRLVSAGSGPLSAPDSLVPLTGLAVLIAGLMLLGLSWRQDAGTAGGALIMQPAAATLTLGRPAVRLQITAAPPWLDAGWPVLEAVSPPPAPSGQDEFELADLQASLSAASELKATVSRLLQAHRRLVLLLAEADRGRHL